MKKILALLLAALMALTLLCACAPGTDKPNDPSSSQGQEDTKPTDDSEVSKFKGEKFYVVDYDLASVPGYLVPKVERDYTEEQLNSEEDRTFTAEARAQADRVLELENKYGIQLVNVGYTLWFVTDGVAFAASLASGEFKADIFHTENRVGRDWYIGGAVESLSKLSKYIDLNNTDKWGNKSMQMACTYKGETWGVPWHGSAYSPCQYIIYGQMLVNLKTFSQFNTDWTSQSLIEDGLWTFEKFAEILPQVSNPDKSNRVRGLHYQGQSLLAMIAVYANGGNKVVYDEEQGKYVFGLTSEKALNAIDWVKGIVTDTSLAMASTSVGDFLKGKCTYFITDPNRVFDKSENGIASNLTEFQFLPFPYGTDAVAEGNYGKTYGVYIIAGESCCGIYHHADLDKSLACAKLFNELTEPVYIGKGSEAELYQDWLFRQFWEEDEEGDNTYKFSYDVYRQQGINLRWDFSLDLGDMDSSITQTLGTIFKKDGAVASELLGALEEGVNAQLNETVNP